MGVLLLEPLLVDVRMGVHDVAVGVLVLVLDVVVVVARVGVGVELAVVGVLVAVGWIVAVIVHRPTVVATRTERHYRGGVVIRTESR